jgi:hypothetical protein
MSLSATERSRFYRQRLKENPVKICGKGGEALWAYKGYEWYKADKWNE